MSTRTWRRVGSYVECCLRNVVTTYDTERRHIPEDRNIQSLTNSQVSNLTNNDSSEINTNISNADLSHQMQRNLLTDWRMRNIQKDLHYTRFVRALCESRGRKYNIAGPSKDCVWCRPRNCLVAIQRIVPVIPRRADGFCSRDSVHSYFERRKASLTKQFGTQTHRIYTGNIGGCGQSVAIIYPNYMQHIYSTQMSQNRNSVVILSPRSSSFQPLQIPTLGGTECRKRYVVMAQFKSTTPMLQSVF